MLVGNAVGTSDLTRGMYDEKRNALWDRRADLRQQVGMRDNDLGAAVAHHVSYLRSLPVPIDRHAISAEPLRGIARLEEWKIVAQHYRNRVDGVEVPGGAFNS